MSEPRESIYPTSLGIVGNQPAIVVGEMVPLVRCGNLSIRDKALQARQDWLARYSGTNLSLKNIVHYVDYSSGYLFLYVLGGQSGGESAWQLAPATSPATFGLTGLGLNNVSDTTNLYFSSVIAEDGVYICSPSIPVTKLAGSSKTQLSFDVFGTVRAQYAISADSHLMLGNLIQNGTSRRTRLIWSDLYDYSDFVLDPSQSEVGSFDLPSTDFEITGLSYQRGFVHIYTQESIWRARYVGFDQGVWLFEPLYQNLGNVYHYAVVAAKEMDFFIGPDSFYRLDGGAVQAIGDEIWKFFNGTRDTTYGLPVRGEVDLAAKEVYWTYKANGNWETINGKLWQVVYNYDTGQWTARHARGERDRWAYRYSSPSTLPCNSTTVVNGTALGSTACNHATTGTYACNRNFGTWENETLLITDSTDGDQIMSVKSTYGNSKLTGGAEKCYFATHYFIFGSIASEKEIYKVRAIYQGANIAGAAAKAAGHEMRLQVWQQGSYHEGGTLVADVAMEENEPVFYLRNMTPGQYILFYFQWYNTAAYYCNSFIGFSVERQEPETNHGDR